MTSTVRAPHAAAAPTTRSRKRPAAPAAISTPDTTIAAANQASHAVPPELRLQWVAEAAYYIAERRGFRDGSPEDDWSQAEAQFERLLAASRPPGSKRLVR